MNITIAIPDSSISDCSDLRTKTEKLFRIARALAIFKVKRCLIYRSPFLKPKRASAERRVISAVLRYLECPQYLRKRLFGMVPELSFVGALPPLATLHHLTSDTPKVGEIREGALFITGTGNPVVDIGMRHPVDLLKPPKYSLREKVVRVSVRIHEQDGVIAEILDSEMVSQRKYNGYRIREAGTLLSKAIKHEKGQKIATSSRCELVSGSLLEKIRQQKEICLLFGSPSHGLGEILKAEGKKISDVSDICINLLKGLGTRSLRLEEALMVVLTKLA